MIEYYLFWSNFVIKILFKKNIVYWANILGPKNQYLYWPNIILENIGTIYGIGFLGDIVYCILVLGFRKLSPLICILRLISKSDIRFAYYANRTSDLRITKYSIETSRIDLKTSRIDLRIDLKTSRINLNAFWEQQLCWNGILCITFSKFPLPICCAFSFQRFS